MLVASVLYFLVAFGGVLIALFGGPSAFVKHHIRLVNDDVKRVDSVFEKYRVTSADSF